jgi:hypothetical protein
MYTGFGYGDGPDVVQEVFIEPTAIPQTDLAKFYALSAQIESLSGVFCEPVSEPISHLVTNDRGMDRVIPKVREHLRQRPPGGVGIFIGSAGLISLLPDLKLDAPVTVDRDPAVIEFNLRLNRAILAESRTLCTLSDQASVCRYVAGMLGKAKGGLNNAYGPSFLEETILAEAERFGSEHWSNPQRITEVADALRNSEPTYVTADLTNPGFLKALSAICQKQDEQITFANLTNVHGWIDRSDMSFLRELSFSSDSLIMFSVDVNEDAPLEARLAYSLEEYIQIAGDSWNGLMKDADWLYESYSKS